MRTLLLTHPACLLHDTGPSHPERPERLRAVLAALEAERFALLDRAEAPLAERAALEAVHEPAYVSKVLAAIPQVGLLGLDNDTVISPGSGEAALHAAGAGIAAVDAVMAGTTATAFCAVRPPGHHAEPGEAMGFCLFNNAAIAARHAVEAHGLARVAIVDFDVHHGNGTQSACWDDPALFYASTHQAPLFPNTGFEHERGAFDNIANVTLHEGDGSEEFRMAWQDVLLPRLAAFAPQLVVISAGFDAHRRDPLAGLRLDERDFAWLTAELVRLADAHAGGRVVSLLEGGYDCDALALCAAEHVATLMTGG